MTDTASLQARRERRVHTLVIAAVWLLRVAVGGVFIVSGFAKADDLYGFVFKIEDYLSAWDMTQPRSLVLVAAGALSCAEFVLGALLMFGCYRRMAPLLMTVMMAFMLPLTLYVYIKSPVPDCGCFGDFLVIGNGATFFKNLAITAALVFLLFANRRVEGLYGAYSQWLVGACVTVYVLVVATLGYSAQPLIDFRPYPVGTSLLGSDTADSAPEFEFVYERGSERKTFTADNIPTDTSWVFVERRLVGGSDKPSALADFVITDPVDGADVTADVISPEGTQVLVVIPEYDRADVSSTYLINEMEEYLSHHGGEMMAIVGGTPAQIEEWTDLSMADYPVYAAEPTVLKSLARGTMAIVCLRDGVIQWKRTASSINSDIFEEHNLEHHSSHAVADSAVDSDTLLESLDTDGVTIWRSFTITLLAVLFIIFVLDRSGRMLVWTIRLRRAAR